MRRAWSHAVGGVDALDLVWLDDKNCVRGQENPHFNNTRHCTIGGRTSQLLTVLSRGQQLLHSEFSFFPLATVGKAIDWESFSQSRLLALMVHVAPARLAIGRRQIIGGKKIG